MTIFTSFTSLSEETLRCSYKNQPVNGVSCLLRV